MKIKPARTYIVTCHDCGAKFEFPVDESDKRGAVCIECFSRKTTMKPTDKNCNVREDEK